jgi:hypothetical protein
LVLRKFHARLASSEAVQEVVARGWDPVRKQPLVGQAAAPTLLLRAGANEPTLLLGRTTDFTVDHPIFSVQEARALAAEGLAAALASRTDAEIESGGSDVLRAGGLATVQGLNDRFDGRYLITGVTHRYTDPDACGDGYVTRLKVKRAAPALFFLPEIDDEVLVAFKQGDLGEPYVVGSLWDDDDEACSTDGPDPD